MFTKNEMEKYLNSFPGKFREIFAENSKSIRINMVNGKIKMPNISENEGVWVLSRTWSEEFYKVLSWSNFDFRTELQSFVKSHDLSGNIHKVELSWDKELVFDEFDFSDSIKEVSKDIEKAFAETFANNQYIRASQVVVNFSHKNFIVWNTNWKFGKDSLFYNTIFISLVWMKDWKTEEVFEKITWIDILEDINEERILSLFKAAEKQLDLQFRAEKAPNWDMYVLVWSEAWGTIIHEAVGHGLEWDLQWSSAYAWKVGQKVASENVTVVDDPTRSNLRGYYEIDHEWTPAKKTVLIENWILKTYLHTNKTAEKFWVESTWHARKEDYTYRNLVRMWSTYLDVWTDKKDDLIAKVDSWIYVSKMWWGQVNTVTWDFVFDVKYGFRIENGELKEEIKWATISWNGPEMLNNIFWVCNDLDFFDGWTCWKWQAMPVSDANPTFLTRLKVTGVG